MSAATLSGDSESSYAARLAVGIPQLLPKHLRVVSILPVSAPGGQHPNVKRVILSTGGSVIAKRHLFAPVTAGHPYHLLSVEQAASDLLVRNGCPVPSVLGVIEELGVVILEDVGKGTLDDFVQSRPPLERANLAAAAVDAFVHIQETLIRQNQLKEEVFAPGCDKDSIRSSFLGLKAAFDADSLRSLIARREKIDTVLSHIHRVVLNLADQPMAPGPTDYNARNIVVAKSGDPIYLEWSKLGYDWPERRVVQYLTSLGAGTRGAQPRTLIDPWIATRYAAAVSWSDPEAAAFSLDGHHLIFHLLLALRWAAQGDSFPRGIRAALSTPLSRSPVTIGLRRLFS